MYVVFSQHFHEKPYKKNVLIQQLHEVCCPFSRCVDDVLCLESKQENKDLRPNLVLDLPYSESNKVLHLDTRSPQKKIIGKELRDFYQILKQLCEKLEWYLLNFIESFLTEV